MEVDVGDDKAASIQTGTKYMHVYYNHYDNNYYAFVKKIVTSEWSCMMAGPYYDLLPVVGELEEDDNRAWHG